VVALASVAAVAAVWALFVSPQATIELARPLQFVVELAVWTAAGAALYAAGRRPRQRTARLRVTDTTPVTVSGLEFLAGAAVVVRATANGEQSARRVSATPVGRFTVTFSDITIVDRCNSDLFVTAIGARGSEAARRSARSRSALRAGSRPVPRERRAARRRPPADGDGDRAYGSWMPVGHGVTRNIASSCFGSF
jgi:uncharacterized protein DUF2568